MHLMKKIALGLVYLAFLALARGATAPVPVPGPVPNPSAAPNAPGSPAVPELVQPGSAAEAESLWKRDTLFGDLGGVRRTLDDHGITITPVYTGEVMGNVSGGAGGYHGVGHGAIYEHSLNVPLDVDFSRLVRGWEGATFHVNAFWIAGPGLSPSYVGNVENTSNIQAYNTLRLQELWYQQRFLHDRISLKIGQIAADSEFFTTASGSLYVNGTFGTFALVGANLPDNPTYPMAVPAVRLRVQPVDQVFVQVGVFDGDAGSQAANNHGTAFPLDGGDGVLVFSEAGYLLNQAAGDKGLRGTYKLGSFVHTRNFASWSSRAAGTPSGDGSDYGIYGVVDQQLYAQDGRSISLFTRAGYAPAAVNAVEWYVDGGLDFTGFVPGRPHDVAGIAVARSRFSGDYSDAQGALNGTNPYTAETVIEATYKVQLTPWWDVQPDFQYIVTPSGVEGSHNAAVLGLRTAVTF